jgi:hypothetical protein
MLEAQGLRIGPWTSASVPERDQRCHSKSAGGARIIRDTADGNYLGLARRRSVGKWLGKRRAVEVLEDEDASLLFTVQRCFGWPRRWAVLDADGRRIGTVRPGPFAWPDALVQRWDLGRPPAQGKPRYPGTLVEDWYGHLLAWVEDPRARAVARLVARDGQVMGTVTLVGPDTVVEFEAVPESNPFWKMALLSALLVDDASLNRRE